MTRLWILIAALLAVCAAAPAAEVLPGPYGAEILRVIDGDTVEARVRVWLGLDQTVRIRLRDVDAPEMHGRCPGEPRAAQAARDHLIGLLATGPVTVTDVGLDKYGGRVDARLRLADGSDISQAMVAAGHAQPSGRARIARCPKDDRP